MNRREASKKETRRLIVKVARKLFAQKGMEECTIRDIAKKAGVSPASVVVHFKSKTALLEEVFSTDVGRALSELIATMPKSSDLPDQLMHLARGMLRFYDKNRNLYRALLRFTIFEPTTETPNMSRQSEEYIKFLSRLIEGQKTDGIIRSEVDSTVAAASIFFLYLGALTVLFRMPEMAVETIVDGLASMTDQYLKGIYVNKRRV
jgi:AcrR family transcriptional regulator